ncbi:ketoacyl-ACP synthase III [Coriobacteriia bacterium Es71-Z0120]|uniref:beta-ketoacyl-ACP synthase III n=1 Tax=Parvivirga hydrogeniphila TaxID=2939460 RepID=UPI002260D2A9|nr:beta-ketoacyl-ACP synthase III [Parvivirga hydrogeniphila]MCL4079560.1 ketoacyl-ACP synthase III [Parvivirga hydrogeniphila]
MTHARITGIGSYLPETVLTNQDLETMVETTDEWIVTRTGIRERRLAHPAEATSDLGAEAARRALADASLSPADLDLIVVGTSSPDKIFPSTACLLAAKIGASCPALDAMAACTSFVYALHTATTAIESGRAKRVLVVGADALTRHVDFTDRATCVLFGDGAGAVVVEAGDEPGVLGIDLGADGTRADVLEIPGCGSAMPASEEVVASRLQFIKMDGQEVFKFAVRVIPGSVRRALALSGLSIGDLDWLVPHQANQRILDTIADRLGLAHDRVFSNIAKTGNTSAASIPLALDALYTGRNLRPGSIVGLVGFGAGLTWGSALLRWTKEAR